MFVLNIRDSAYNSVGLTIAQQLGKLPGAENVMIVTPEETRMFDLRGKAIAPARTTSSLPTTQQAQPSQQEPEDDTDFDSDPQADAQRLAAEASAEADRIMNGLDADPTLNSSVPDSPAASRKAMLDQRRAEASTAQSVCGRCRGQCVILVPMEGGTAVEQSCPVCRGEGFIRRYGHR